MDFGTLLNFFIALALGGLIGVERQRKLQEGDFAGIRSFMLIAFIGALSGFLYKGLNDQIIIFIILFTAITILISSSYIISSLKGYFGITTEVTALVTFVFGFMVMFDEYKSYALVFTVLITILLTFKDTLHHFIQNTKRVEWTDTIKFSLITLVILPLIPEKIHIPLFSQPELLHLNEFYPREIWLLVVFVSGISFIGYFLVKLLGQTKGANLMGAIGGLVSSTAVTQSLSTHSNVKKDGKEIPHQPFVSAVLLATLVSFVRAIIICLSISRELTPIIVPFSILIIFGVFILVFYIYHKDKNIKTEIHLKSPLKLKPALILGIMYALLTFLSKASYTTDFGRAGIVFASIVTGFFDMDPVILTVSSLSATGTIAINDAICSILLAVASNQITKAAIAFSSGSKKFGRSIATILLLFVFIILVWVTYFKLS